MEEFIEWFSGYKKPNYDKLNEMIRRNKMPQHYGNEPPQTRYGWEGQDVHRPFEEQKFDVYKPEDWHKTLEALLRKNKFDQLRMQDRQMERDRLNMPEPPPPPDHSRRNPIEIIMELLRLIEEDKRQSPTQDQSSQM